MRSSDILKIARRRAGISQAELAARMGIARPNVTRWESGEVLPSLERLSDAVEACGLELGTRFWAFDDSYSPLIARQLRLDPLERFSSMGGDTAQLLAAAAAIERSGIPYVAIGAVAAALRGSPVTLGETRLEVAVDRDQAPELAAALTNSGIVDGVDFTPEPANTRGVVDLLADSDPIELAEGVTLQTASTIDLRRVSEAPNAGYQPSPAVLAEMLRAEAGEVRPESRRRVARDLETMARA